MELHHLSVTYDRFFQGVSFILQIEKHGIQLSLDFLERQFAYDSHRAIGFPFFSHPFSAFIMILVVSFFRFLKALLSSLLIVVSCAVGDVLDLKYWLCLCE